MEIWKEEAAYRGRFVLPWVRWKFVGSLYYWVCPLRVGMSVPAHPRGSRGLLVHGTIEDG